MRATFTKSHIFRFIAQPIVARDLARDVKSQNDRSEGELQSSDVEQD